MERINKIKLIILVALIALSLGFNDVHAQGAPSVTTGSVDMLSARGGFLNATINPNGATTEVWFQMDTVNPPLKARGFQGAGDGTSSVNIRASAISLRLSTTYYYRAIAKNYFGITYGEVRSFTTGGDGSSSGSTSNTSGSITSGNTSSGGYNTGSTVPSVATNGPVSVSASSAVINGSVNPNNNQTKFWFEFGTTQSLGQTTTSVQLSGSGSTWELVTGNLSGLKSGRTYYYRVVAQNGVGTAVGEIKSLTTSASGNQSSSQVLGASTGSGTSNGVANNGTANLTGSGQSTSSSVAGSVTRPSSISAKPKVNSRPSFISLEYSLSDNGALVHVVNNIKPKPGEEFNYTIVYKNDSAYRFNEATLKVLIPSEAYYISSSIEPIKSSSNIVELNLGDIEPGIRESITITVKIKDDVPVDTNMIFTSVLGYKDRLGTQLATTSYMTVIVGDGGEVSSSLSASFLSSIFGSTGMIIFIALGLIILLGISAYTLVRIKKNGKNSKVKETAEDVLGFNSIPATFEPIGPLESYRK